MLCYSFLEKRGDYIKTFINWSLLNDGLIVILNKNVECEYVVNKYIKYKEDNDTFNLINLEEDYYLRENNEFVFKIDFKNNLFSYTLKENNITIEDKVECQITKNDRIINLKYRLDDEEKEIIIQIL